MTGRQIKIRRANRRGAACAAVAALLAIAPGALAQGSIDEIQPSTVPSGTGDANIDLVGTFTAGLFPSPPTERIPVIGIDGAGPDGGIRLLPTTVVAGGGPVPATRLRATLPASLTDTPGQYPVRAWECLEDVAIGAPGDINTCGTPSPASLLVISGPVVEPPPPPPSPGGPVVDGLILGGNGEPGAPVTVTGSGFGGTQDQSVLRVGSISVGGAPIWRDGAIVFPLPENLPPGTYDVTLSVGGQSLGVGDVTVGEAPVEAPIPNPVLLPASGSRVSFDASAALDPASGAGPGDTNANAVGLTGISSILWRFGDGATSTEAVVDYTYTKPGTYTPSVTVTTPSGVSRTVGAGRVTVTGSGSTLRAKLPPVNFSVPSRIVFDAGAYTIRPEGRSYLLRLAELVNEVGRRTEIHGHTDDLGPASYNQTLSEERARAVRTFLVEEGSVPPGLIAAFGYGERRPVAGNDTALGRQRNRRVELKIRRGNTPIRLTPNQLRINQRISQAAINRERAIRARLSQGLTAADIRDGSLDQQSLAPTISTQGTPDAGLATPLGNPISVRPLKKVSGNVRRSARQLEINQRISQAAVRRVNQLQEILNTGLTGAVIRDGALSSQKLVPGITVTAMSSGPPPPRISFDAPPKAASASGKVSLTQEQLIINQRISQAAIRRLAAIQSRIESGLSGVDFRDGTITAEDFSS